MFDYNKFCRINKPVKFLNYHNKDELQCNKTVLKKGHRFEGENSFLQGHQPGGHRNHQILLLARDEEGKHNAMPIYWSHLRS